MAWLTLGLSPLESFLVGAVIASTDAAAVFFLLHARGLRLRPRVNSTLEVESATNDPFAIFLTIVLVEILLVGNMTWTGIVALLVREALFGTIIGLVGGRAMVFVLNRLNLPQGLHAPFIAAGALVTFGLAQAVHGSGFLAVYLAGLVVGNRATRARSTLIAFLDAATWLAQIAMFVLLAAGVAKQLADACFQHGCRDADISHDPSRCSCALRRFAYAAETAFIGWGLRGAVGIPCVDPAAGEIDRPARLDVGFVVAAFASIRHHPLCRAGAHCRVARCRVRLSRRTRLRTFQELVGYRVAIGSPYLRHGITPNWAKLTLVVREERVLTPEEAGAAREGDHLYFLAPPERAQTLDRFFVDMPPSMLPDPRLLGDFFLPSETTLGALAEIYNLPVETEQTSTTLADYSLEQQGRKPHVGDKLLLGDVVLQAHTVSESRLITVGIQLGESETPEPENLWAWIKSKLPRRKGGN
jgi:cell volume regulation protein A